MTLFEILSKSKLRPWVYLTCMGVSACASTGATPSAPVSTAPTSAEPATSIHNSDMDAQLMYRVLTSEIAERAGAYDVAFALMLEAAKSRKEDKLFERVIAIASEARAGNSALKAAHTWQRHMPESISAVRQTFGLELALQRWEDASKTLGKLFEITPVEGLAALTTQLPAALRRLNQAELRLKLAQRGLQGFLADAQRGTYAHTVLGTLALQQQLSEQALDHVSKALSLQADSPAAATLVVALLEQGQVKAQVLMDGYLKLPTASARVRLFYIRHLIRSNRIGEAYKQLEYLTQSHPDQAEAWLLLGRLQFERRQYDAAAASTYKASELATDDKFTQGAWMQLSEIAQAQTRWDEAESYLKRISEPDDDLEWRFRLASLRAAQGELNQGLKLIQEWPTTDADERLRRTLREIRLLRDFEALDQAYERLEQARQDFPADNDLLYAHAMVAERLNRHDDMERFLRLRMTRDPKDHQAFNALGYSLADRGVRLDEAQALIEAAMKLAPGDPFVTDSWGWVLFRQGKLTEAARVLSAAWESRSDAEIAAHLGEVLWTQGLNAQARQTWAQGLALDPSNKTLRETLKRLQVSL